MKILKTAGSGVVKSSHSKTLEDKSSCKKNMRSECHNNKDYWNLKRF